MFRRFINAGQRVAWNGAVLGIALFLGLLGQQQLQKPDPGLVFGLLCIIAALAMLFLIGYDHDQDTDPVFPHKHALIAGMVGIALVGLVVHFHTLPPSHGPALLLTLWILGNGLFLLGMWFFDRNQSTTQVFRVAWDRFDVLILALVFLLALFFRVSAVGRIPLTMSGDEANMAMEATRVRSGQIKDPFTTGWLSHPTLWFYLQALSINLFGQTMFGVRMLSALLGSLAVPALYWFGRVLFNRRIALLAALFFAGYHLHIHFSRLALNNVADPLWGLLTLGCWLMAYRTKRYWWYALTGTSAGLAMYFYMGARLFVIVVGLLTLITAFHAWRQWRSINRFQTWLPVMFMTLALLVVGAPLFQTFTRNPDEFMARVNQQRWTEQDIQLAMERSNQSRFKVIYDQVTRSVFAFNAFPDVSTFYDDTRPLLWGLASLCMLFGMGLSLFRIRSLPYLMLLAWFGLGIFFGNIMLRNPPNSPRYVNLTPVVCLWIAIALDFVAGRFEKVLPGKQPRLYTTIGAAAVVLYLMFASINGYFRDYVNREKIGGVNTHLAMALTTYLQDQPANTQVWFMVPPRMFYHGFAMLDFLAGQVHAEDVMEPVTNLDQVPPANSTHPTIYVLSPERLSELALLREKYPQGIYQELTWPLSQGILAYVYRVEIP